MRIHTSGNLLRSAGLTALALIAFASWHYARLQFRSNHNSGLPAQNGTVHSNDPKQLVAEANRFAWLFNGPKAEPLYAKAEQLFAQAGDHRNELSARIGRIRAQAETMSFVDISDYLATQLKTPLVQADPELKLWCLTSKGYTDIEIDPAAAKRDWEQAQAIAENLGKKQWETRARGELGLIAFLEGDSGKAARLVGGALLSTMASGDVGGQVRFLELIGNGLNEIKRHDDALHFYDRAIKLSATTKDAGFPFMAYEGKAEALAAIGKADDARSALESALAQARLDHKRGHEAQLLIILGKLCAQTDDRAHAVEYLESAGSFAGQLKFYRMVGDSMFELAKIYREDGDLQKAEARLSVGLDASRRVGDQYYVPRNLTALADLKARQGHTAEADALYDQAEDVINGILVNSPGHYSESSLAGAMSETFRAHFRLAVETKDVRKAFAILERVRGRTAADVLRTHASTNNNESPAASTIESNIAHLQVTLMRSQVVDERKQLLDTLEEEEQKLALINNVSAPTGRLSLERPADIRKVQQTLRPDEFVLEYVLDEPRSFCLAFSKTDTSITALAGRKQIEDLTDHYLAQIKSMQPGSEASKQLYAALIGPLPHEADKPRIIIVPDGKLHLLPFESLRDGQGRYLLLSSVITYAPSATVLRALRSGPRRSAAARNFLGVGDVTYEPHGTLLARVANSSSLSGKVLRGLYDLAGVHLQDLPQTREEVQAAEREIGPKNSVLLMGDDATETEFKAQPLDEFKIIHLAVHSIASTRYPERSALVLARDPRAQDDGLLQVREIAKLKLNADLVTLSACETGIGKLQGEEGVTNLVQAFLLAGAKAVVASLWAAEDNYTTDLMDQFYRHLAQKEPKATALRQAKLDLLTKYADKVPPFYWAGFIIVGDGSSAIPLRNP